MCGKEEFARGFRIALQRVRIESRCEIQEIRFAGAWAYCWNHLWVTVTPLKGSPQRRESYTLSIFGKNSAGNRLLVRDANMLTLEPQA
jgi:ketosteroid isomerase-like protein